MGKVTFKDWAKPDDPIYTEAFLSIGGRVTVIDKKEAPLTDSEPPVDSEPPAIGGINDDSVATKSGIEEQD